jgi:hypothetical protein
MQKRAMDRRGARKGRAGCRGARPVKPTKTHSFPSPNQPSPDQTTKQSLAGAKLSLLQPHHHLYDSKLLAARDMRPMQHSLALRWLPDCATLARALYRFTPPSKLVYIARPWRIDVQSAGWSAGVHYCQTTCSEVFRGLSDRSTRRMEDEVG